MAECCNATFHCDINSFIFVALSLKHAVLSLTGSTHAVLRFRHAIWGGLKDVCCTTFAIFLFSTFLSFVCLLHCTFGLKTESG